MPEDRVPTARSRVKAGLIAGGFSLLLALSLARPVYAEVATRSAFLAGTLQADSATVLRTDVDGGYNMSQNWQEIEFEAALPDGRRYVTSSDERALWPGLYDKVQVGMLGDELVTVNGHYVRGMFPFGYFVLLMILTAMTVFTAIMVIRSRAKVPGERLPETTYFAWPAGWLFLPVGLVFDTVFDSPWWPVIGWAGSATLLLSIYTAKFVSRNADHVR